MDELFKTTQVPQHPCLKCGKPLSAATSFEKAEPRPGDISICVECGNVAAYAEGLSLRPLNWGEWLMLLNDARYGAMMRPIAERKAKNN